MAGGSHTNFDTSAFTVGAIGGAATIAGAVASGVANVVVARRERGMTEAVDSRDVEIRRMQRRIASQRSEIGRRDVTIRDQALTIHELGLRLQMTQYLRQRGR